MDLRVRRNRIMILGITASADGSAAANRDPEFF
jgi:hypothetical protein